MMWLIMLRNTAMRGMVNMAFPPNSPRPLPKGTRLECIAYYDNSPNNPANPDPKAEVVWGDQTWEEMLAGFLDLAFDVGTNPDELVKGQPLRRGGD